MLNVFVVNQALLQLLEFEHEYAAVSLANSRRLSESILPNYDFLVAKVRARSVQAQWQVESLVRFQEGLHIYKLQNVYIEHNSAILYEEYFLCLVSLVEKDIVVKQVHYFKSRNDVDQEILALILEEHDLVDDLAVRLLDHFTPQR